jgi:hypothetical protein
LALATEVVASKTTIAANTEPTKPSRREDQMRDRHERIHTASGRLEAPYGGRKVFVSEMGELARSVLIGACRAAKFNGYRAKIHQYIM